MCWKKLTIAAAAFTAVLFLPYTFKSNLSFGNLDEAGTRIRALGYHCLSDRRDGVVENGFAVSRTELVWGDVNNLIKVGAMGPEWRGIIWIALIDDGLTDLYTIPDWAGTRVWGNVVAMGDADLLLEVEANLLESAR